jgi:hypothetical protein
MSTPTSPSTSRQSLSHDVLLPDVPMSEVRRVPKRPPPPSEEQRPDLSMFRGTTEITRAPVVTRLRIREDAQDEGGRERDLRT